MPAESPYYLLNQGLEALGIQLNNSQIHKLLSYLRALAKWNRVYNLTAIEDQQHMVPYHLLDSLAVKDYIQGTFVLDLGTGAGLPGIPLAVCHPNKHFVLMDASAKKVRFLKQVKYELGLDNIKPVHCRCEPYSNHVIFDTIITRALGSIPFIQNQACHLAGQGTRWLFMKGEPQAETDKLSHASYYIQPLSVPGVNRKRYIVWTDE